MTLLTDAIARVDAVDPLGVRGSVEELRGLSLLVDDLPVGVGSLVSVGDGRRGEVVGFSGGSAVVMLLDGSTGVRPGDPVRSLESTPTMSGGRSLLGRVVNGLGEPIDGRGPLMETRPVPLHAAPVNAMSRGRIRTPLSTGVRTLDLLTTVGLGQRMGVFAGPGVGKSTLLSGIAKHSSSDLSVIALIGERGREVGDFIEHTLGESGLARSVVVVATSDESPLLRVRAGLGACALAQSFADNGDHVTLVFDSVTRFAHAQRQIGLAVGEPPATKGYTPSVFAQLPLLLERAGVMASGGSITGFYSVLVEGDDMTEPIADAVRGILDGHVILSRKLARQGHFPAIDPLDSISRLAEDITGETHRAARSWVIKLLSAYAEAEELIQIGAYAQGADLLTDVAVELKPQLDQLLRQARGEHEGIDESLPKMVALAQQAQTLVERRAAGAGAGRRGG
ncbi:MAG: FliI/YscN family ATPase [Planctomycetota bacterium]